MIQKYLSWKWISCLAVLFFSGCKEPYDPVVKASGARFLVVEGYINVNGLTTIRLSRTRNVTAGDTAGHIHESGAQVVIEDNNNGLFPLYESGQGVYSGNYYLSLAAHYRLHITTADRKEYLSDFVSSKQAPPIGGIGWEFHDGDVQIEVSTSDPLNKTRFYRWSYAETWEFHTAYFSNYVYNPADSTVINRAEQVYTCWRSQPSSNILLGSTAKLKEDEIHQAPLVLIPHSDPRISVLYSILVTQYALDSSAYNYWNALKGNNENVGSIFDPQPNMTTGNIHCKLDPSETVIGYIGAGSTSESRIFISHSSMPNDWNFESGCSLIDVPPDSLVYYFGDQGYVPVMKDAAPSLVKGYFASTGSCVDCTLNGSNVKPVFWP